ncbi:hypothetical protein C8Q75DRAFT_753018 [Abortiporus biennis]|nr:hypothetical protein C8Q75DRAFT_753018 [Abortiporus biennis]
MGQYWTVVNLDKRQNLGSMGKLGEALPYNGFHKLGTHLRRFEGIKSPEVIVEVIKKDEPESSLQSKPSRKYRSYFNYTKKSITQPLSPSTLGDLGKIPIELLFEILRQLPDFIDVISFSLTNTNIYFLGYKLLQRRYLDDAADWEGDRIICLGDYSEWDTLPRGSFTKAELEKICVDHEIEYKPVLSTPNDGTNTPDGMADDESIPEDLVTALETKWSTPYEYVENNFRPPRREYGLPGDIFKKYISKRLDLDLQWYSSTYTNLNTLLEANFKEYSYTMDSPPLLCNISKRVYIDVCEVLKMEGKNLSWIEVLASRICWSADPSVSMCDDDVELSHGVWAGDRFARRRLDLLHELGGEGEWKDVTEQELERIKSIWIRNFGEDEWQT